MKVFIFHSNLPNINFALASDGTVLKTFGDGEIDNVADFYGKEYAVEVVDEPQAHKELQAALRHNKARSRIATGGPGWARVELFRWQYGELPKKGDTRAINVNLALKKMVPAVICGEAVRENVAVVLAYLESLLPEMEDVEL